MFRAVRLYFLLALGAATVAAAQDAPPAAADSAHSLRLYLDCAVAGCDWDYLRTQFTLVNYVRDQGVADVQVISTSLGTGSGGREVTLKFHGLRGFSGVDDELHYTTPQGASSDEQRKEFVRVLKLGLTRYLVHTPARAELALTARASGPAAPVQAAHDPWNFWVFSVGFNGSFNGESQSKSTDWSGSFSGNRTTEDWKIRFSLSGYRDNSSYDLGDGTTYNAKSHSYSGSGLVARSMGPHLSSGVTLSGSSSSQQNIDFRGRVAPTLEYDFFSYDDYTRKRLVLSYSLGLNRYAYTDTTIYDKVSETVLDHAGSLSFSSRQTWGSANVGLSYSNFLSDFRKYRASIYGGMSIRIVKGLQFSYSASYARVHDQITLPKAGASNEEILLRLRQLRTSYEYYGYFGLSYTFGSVFNNVVNPRLGGSSDCC